MSYRGKLFSRPFVRLALGAACATGLLALMPGANGSAVIPSGYASKAARLGTGLEHDVLSGRTPSESVHVARLSPNASFELRAVPAHGAVGRGLERTSSICARVHCLAAVNGDFFGPRNNIPLGAVVSFGQLLRSPTRDHPQLMLSRNGHAAAGIMRLSATLVTTDLESLHIDTINEALRGGAVALYTPAFGPTTATPKGTTEVVIRARRPAGSLGLSRTTVVNVASAASHSGNAKIPADGAVLAARGPGNAKLADLGRRMKNGDASSEALLRVDSPSGAVDSVGGGPLLVRAGKVVVPDVRNNFYRGRHPRTIVGWTKSGQILLVTVDGRQPGRSAGMTLVEAANFMRGLGATDAINLDGGGSTTFVERGKVVNTPSDKAIRRGRRTVVLGDVDTRERILGYVERPVATALVVVPRSKAVATHVDGEAFSALPITQTAPTTTELSMDAAGSPDGSQPVIVVRVRSTSPLLPYAVALCLLAAAFTAGRRKLFFAIFRR